MTIFLHLLLILSNDFCLNSSTPCACHSTGGISFVLNSGTHWMHNPEGGGDWFVPLSGWLPVTGDTTDLPDAELYPVSLAPSPDDPQEVSDRAVLRRKPSRETELAAERRAAKEQESKAKARISTANASLNEAEGALASALAAEKAAMETVARKEKVK